MTASRAAGTATTAGTPGDPETAAGAVSAGDTETAADAATAPDGGLGPFAYLRGRPRALIGLAAWSLLEAGQTFLVGFALARAVDHGFLRGRDAVGLGWLALAALAVPAGAYGTARVFRAVAALVEPLRDLLVRTVVRRALRGAVRDGRSGDTAAVSRLTHQVEIARDSFAGVVMVLRSFVFTAAGALAGLCALAPVLLLAVVPPLAAGIALFALSLRPLARRQHRFLAADEALAEEFGAVAGGLRDITACGAEDRTARESDQRIDEALSAARSLARTGVVRAAALAVGGQLPVVLLLLGAPWLLTSHRVTPGALLGALAYLTQSLQPALQNLVHALGAAGTRLGVVLARVTGAGTQPQPQSGPGQAAGAGSGAAASGTKTTVAPWTPSSTGTGTGTGTATASATGTATTTGSASGRSGPTPVLELRGVTFAYGPGALPVLRDLDLSVPQGDHLAVVGPSGIGKSTLAGLAIGLLRPDAGQVRTAGRPALVPQEAYVFRGSVRENLCYLRPEQVDEAEVMAAVREVGAQALVAALGGLDGEVDPARLSAGERQVVALVRTYLSPAGLVLLDEATCHLDPAAEAVAEAAFARRPGGTLVVIAHRISSARRARRVLVLDGTRAVCGTHEELPARSALYRDLAGTWSPSDPEQAREPAGVSAREPAPEPPAAGSARERTDDNGGLT